MSIKPCPLWLVRDIVSLDKVRWAERSFKPYKSPGPAGIYAVLLQKAEGVILGPLVRTIRTSLVLGHVPRPWQSTRVAFIPKAGKASYVSPKDFRPISLTSFLLKCTERLVDKFIRYKVVSAKPLSSDQHACQVGLSTETALFKVKQLIQSQLGRTEVRG